MSLFARFLTYFFSTAVSSVISFILIPLTTAKLNPSDFGLFALLNVFSGMIFAFSSLGLGFIWATYFNHLEDKEKTHFVSSSTILCVLTAIFWAIIFWFSWPLIRNFSKIFDAHARFYFDLVLFSSVLSSLWIPAYEFLVLAGKAKEYATIVIFATIVSAILTIVGLYVFGFGVGVLFGAAFGGSVIYAIGAIFVMRKYLQLRLKRQWVDVILRKGVPTTPGNILESCGSAVERNVLNSVMSLKSLGLYTHSQGYCNICFSGIKAITRSIWPVSLSEAKNKSDTFPITRSVWGMIFFAIALSGLVSSALGKEFIKVFTHNKFTDTAPYVTAWFIFLAIQNAGREYLAVLYAQNESIFLTYLSVATQFIFIGSIIISVPIFGLWGAVAASIIQMLVYRIAIQFRANKIQRVPFNDGPVITSGSIVLAGVISQIIFWDNLSARILTATILMIVLCIFLRSILKDITATTFRKLKSMKLIHAISR